MTRRARRLPTVFRKPEQGWSSLLLLLGMLVVLGVSIANARPLIPFAGAGSMTDSLVTIMVVGGLIGFVLARSSLGVVRAHVLGALAAALLLLLVAGGALIAADPVSGDWAGLTERVAAVWRRLDADVEAFITEEISTPTLATFLVLGAICWTTGQFSAFSIFRYDRGGPAVMAIGTVLFLNIGLGSLEPAAEALPVLPVLAVFSALAMLLLMRMQLVQQRFQWARRHISDAGEVSRLFLRTGVIFVALAIISASSLTAWATVEAQEVDIGDLEEPFEDLGQEVAKWLGLIGVPPPDPAIAKREQAWSVRDRWDVDLARGTAFTATVEGQLRGNYWWGWADDRFDGRGWRSTGASEARVPALEDLKVAVEASAGGPYRAVTTITIGDSGPVRRMAFRPSEAAWLDRTVSVSRVADGLGVSDIVFPDALDEGDPVVVTSFVRDYSEDGTDPTGNELRAAGEADPVWIVRFPWLERYLQGANDPDINGPGVVSLAADIAARTDSAYDAAVAVQDHLRVMDYQTEMGGVCDAYRSIPECVLAAEQGFCQHFATTMAMVLRELDIPSRVVTGYLPGDRVDEVWTVPQRGFHNWVEAYFPGSGWVRFDPTPGERGLGQAFTAFEDGEQAADDPTNGAPPTGPPPTAEPDEPEASFAPTGGETGDTGAGDGDTIVLVVSAGALAALVLTVLSGLLLFRLRRLPQGDEGMAYRGIVSLATRLGYGPHPSQTEYEYAGTLSESIPTVRDELYVVADARVETAYGQRRIDAERRGLLRRAYGRIRTALLRLSLSRKR